MTREYSRRHVLAGLGTAGAGVGISSFLLAGKSRAYTSYTRVPASSEENRSPTTAADGRGLRVAWWESYNGQVLETQANGSETNATRVLDEGTDPRYVPEAVGPVVSLGNVLPGDEGTVGLGVEADIPGEAELAVWLRTRLVSSEENGVTEPESKHPDEDGTDTGELADLTRVTVWENSGLAGIGANDGRLMPVVEESIEEGSLRAVFAESALGEGLRLGCLGSGEMTYVALRWELPSSVGNLVQSDAATFGLEFRAAPCGGGNPFDGTEGETDG